VYICASRKKTYIVSWYGVEYSLYCSATTIPARDVNKGPLFSCRKGGNYKENVENHLARKDAGPGWSGEASLSPQVPSRSPLCSRNTLGVSIQIFKSVIVQQPWCACTATCALPSAHRHYTRAAEQGSALGGAREEGEEGDKLISKMRLRRIRIEPHVLCSRVDAEVEDGNHKSCDFPL